MYRLLGPNKPFHTTSGHICNTLKYKPVALNIYYQDSSVRNDFLKGSLVNATELYTLKWLTVCYVKFYLEKKSIDKNIDITMLKLRIPIQKEVTTKLSER